MTECENICECHGTGVFLILEGQHKGRYIGILGDSVPEGARVAVFLPAGLRTYSDWSDAQKAVTVTAMAAFGNGILPFSLKLPDSP